MQANPRGRAPSPGLYGIGLAALFLCACALGAPLEEIGDSAASVHPDDDEDAASDESSPAGEVDAEVPVVDAATPAGPDASAMDAATDAAARDASADGRAPLDASRSDGGGGTAGGGTTGGGTTGGGTTGGGTTGGGMTDAGRQDSGAPDAGRPDAGRPDAGTPGGGTTGGGSCEPSKCTNDCSIAAPFRCCTRDGECGCSWLSVAYCND